MELQTSLKHFPEIATAWEILPEKQKEEIRKEERDSEFLKCLGNGKSEVELEDEDDYNDTEED